MSVPPGGGWPPQGGQGPYPAGQHPQYGSIPLGYGPPPGSYGPGSFGPPPPRGGGSLKWLLIAVAVLLVVAISVGATLLFTRYGGGGGATTTAPAPASEYASANDTGPVSIITVEPTCEAYAPVNDAIAHIAEQGWGNGRSDLGPRSTWTRAQQNFMDEILPAMETAANQLIILARQTPHRLVRDIYSQQVHYLRKYVSAAKDYDPVDNMAANAVVNSLEAITDLCTAIKQSAAASAPVKVFAVSATAPFTADSFGESSVADNNSSCNDFIQLEERLVTDTSSWSVYDSSIPGVGWSPEQRAANETVRPVLQNFADSAVRIGRESSNGTFEDLAAAATAYMTGYLRLNDSYQPSYSWLSSTSFRLTNFLSSACQSPRS